jgi:hypothetical protein
MLVEALTDTVAATDATSETALGDTVALSVALADTDADELDDDVICDGEVVALSEAVAVGTDPDTDTLAAMLGEALDDTDAAAAAV